MSIKKNFFAPLSSGLGATRRAAMLLLVMLLTATTAWAQEPWQPGQETSGKCGENVTWELTGDPFDYTLTISGEGAMYDYNTVITAPWSSYAEQIREVVIENDVTTIGDYAFKGTGLTSIEIPASVKSIGAFAFYECTNLGSNQGSVTFAEGSQLESIGESAFNSCTVLTSIEIPASVTSIGNYAFSECHFLGSVTFAEGSQLKSIGAYAFSGTGLTSIEIPAGVKSIGEAAFTGSGLTSIEIPASVTSIGEDAFSFCNNLGSVTFAEGSQLESIGTNAFQSSGLTSITIPASVESIGENVFHNCNNLASMAVANGNTVYDSRNGCNAIIEKSTNTLIIGCKNSTIPAGVTSIGNYAFSATTLTSIEIPASVTSIGMRAFQNCPNLATVTVYAPSCTLGEDAFAYCNKLANIYVFNDLVDDYQGAENWSDYANIITEMLNPHGYCGTTGHETDVIWVLTGDYPNYTLTISGTGDMPDYDDPKERPWHDNAEEITNVVIEEGVTSIGAYAFLDFVGLTSVTIPASVESIGASAFDGCSGLESITIPANVTSIGDYAFSNCQGLTSVTIPANVGSIGVGAFRGCSNLETMTVEDGNEVYKSSNNCIIETSTKTLIAGCKNTIIPNDVTIVTIIGDYAFYKCSDLESITIPDNVTSIGFSAFEGCSGLTSIEIPASVTSIGNYAFEGCSDLTSVTVYAQRCSLGTEAFDECNDELKIYVFKDYVDTYKGAENWSAYEDIIKGIKGGYCGTTGHEKDVIWVLTGESLTISGTGKMANYINSEERPWNSDAKDIKTIVIENGVTSIGAYAFYHCFDLTTVTIPASVESIGDDAFEGCSGLTSIEIPTSVTSIGDYAFNSCTGLTSIVIPASVTSIGNWAFQNCTSLATVTVYAPSCSLGTEAFDEWNVDLKIYVFSHLVSQYQTIWSAYASKITEIIGGYCGTTDHKTDVIWVLTGESSNYTLTISGTGAMADLRQSGIYAVNIKNIKTIVIENGVTSICDNAFEGCTGLTSILIPASVKSIGDYAFAECQGLTSIVIPASVKSIGNYAFSGCTGLTSVTVYAPSCSLGNDAFGGCSELKIYVFSDLVNTYKGAENWSDYADADEDIIKGITGGYCGTTGHETDVIWVLTGESLTISGTGKMAAYDEPTERPWDNNAADISNVVIENGVTTIGNYAFFYCQGLTSVTIPASVTSIGDYAFAECQGLTSVTIPASVTSIGNFAFSNCTGLTSVTIPASVTSIGNFAFSNCTGLTSVTIPASVTSIGDNAFRDCSGLESITIPASVESIGENPFAGCINLATITVEDGNEVYDSPNNNCIIETSTKTLIAGCNNTIIPDDVMSIGNYAFYFCEGLTEVTIPASVTSIGDGAFEGCRNLESTIPASVTSIGVRAFFSCDALTTVTIPASVTSIGEEAFASCINLATMTVDGGNTVYDSRNNCNAIIKKSNNTLIAGCNSSTIPASVESIGEGAFSNCTGLTSIEIPASVTSIGDDAFEGCTGLTSIVIPASVTSIGANAFMYCESLTSVTVYAQSCSLGTEAFDGCNLTNIYVFSDLVDTYKGAENWSDYADIITEMPNPNGKCGDNVRWVLTGESSNYTLTISGTGAMKDYGAPDDLPWKDYRSSITSVVIEDGVTSIGDYAFEGCNNANLTSVTIPASVTSIGDFAFGYCTYLASVTIPVASLTYYGVSAFDNTAAGLKIYVPGSALSTYEAATNWSEYKDNFVGVYTLTYDLAGGTLPAGKSNPESYTAEDKNFLLNNPTKEGYAFAGWKYDYTEGNNTSNHTEVFVEVVPFWEQDLSFTATWVAEDETHKDLAKCRIEVDNPLYIGTGNYVGGYYDNGNGIKVYDGETLLTYDTDYSYSQLVSLDGGYCEDLGEHCRVLLSGEGNYVGGLSADVVIEPKTVTDASWGNLTWSLDGDGKFTITGTGAMDAAVDNSKYPWYKYCNNFTSITIGNGITSIAASAFAGTQNVRPYGGVNDINLPSSLTTIGANAFAFCTHSNLEIDVPTSVVSVGEGAFNGVVCVNATLSDAVEDNTTYLSALSGAQTANVSFSRTFNAGKASTVCLPFDLSSDQVTAAGNFYTFVDVAYDEHDGWVATMQEPSATLTANTPYLFKPSGENVNFSGSLANVVSAGETEATTADGTWTFKGTYKKLTYATVESNENPFSGKVFGFAANGGSNGVVAGEFVRADDGAFIPAFRAFLKYAGDETSLQARGTRSRKTVVPEYITVRLIGKSGEIDGIGEIRLSTGEVTFDSNAWYDLNGHRLAEKPTQRGIYINNGRKITIK